MKIKIIKKNYTTNVVTLKGNFKSWIKKGLQSIPQTINKFVLRALPDSNWDHPNRQLGTLPIKLRALK